MFSHLRRRQPPAPPHQGAFVLQRHRVRGEWALPGLTNVRENHAGPLARSQRLPKPLRNGGEVRRVDHLRAVRSFRACQSRHSERLQMRMAAVANATAGSCALEGAHAHRHAAHTVLPAQRLGRLQSGHDAVAICDDARSPALVVAVAVTVAVAVDHLSGRVYCDLIKVALIAELLWVGCPPAVVLAVQVAQVEQRSRVHTHADTPRLRLPHQVAHAAHVVAPVAILGPERQRKHCIGWEHQNFGPSR